MSILQQVYSQCYETYTVTKTSCSIVTYWYILSIFQEIETLFSVNIGLRHSIISQACPTQIPFHCYIVYMLGEPEKGKSTECTRNLWGDALWLNLNNDLLDSDALKTFYFVITLNKYGSCHFALRDSLFMIFADKVY